MVYIFIKLVSFGVKTAVRMNFCPPTVYIKYRLTSVTSINPPYLLLLLQYKSRCPKICLP